MLVSTSIPLSRQSVPAQARIDTIYATATNPHDGQDQRVVILDVRQVHDVAWIPHLEAYVRAPMAILGYSVPWVDLRNLSAFVTLEI